MVFENSKANVCEDKQCVCPAVDVYETQDGITLWVDMPGADRATLNLELKGDQLVISGQKAKDRLNGKYTELCKERPSDIQYYRSFEIGPQVSKEKIDAVYKNGILKIMLAKSQNVQPKRIEIINS